MRDGSTPLSCTRRRTAGLRADRPAAAGASGAGSAGAGRAGSCGRVPALGAGAADASADSPASAAPPAGLSPASMRAITSPTEIAASTSFNGCNTPASSAGRSTLALSVSSTQIGSPFSTYSPPALSHSRSTTSLIDSPISGTTTSNAITDPQLPASAPAALRAEGAASMRSSLPAGSRACSTISCCSVWCWPASPTAGLAASSRPT